MFGDYDSDFECHIIRDVAFTKEERRDGFDEGQGKCVKLDGTSS